jgi:excisionase family DNA binding protein
MSAPLAYTIATAAEATGLSRQTIDRAIKSGRLRAKRTSVTADGEPAGSYLILADSLHAWLESLPDA